MNIAKKKPVVRINGRSILRDDERRYALTAIGIVQSLRKKTVSTSDSRDLLFNLETLGEIKARRLNPKLIEMMQWGMELPNVERLVPNELNASLNSIVTLANSVLRSSSTVVSAHRPNLAIRRRTTSTKRKVAAGK